MGSFNARHPSRSRPIGSAGCSPMALTAPPRVCGPCFLAHAWATACSTPSTSSRRNSRPSRRLSVRPCTRSSTPCCTGCVIAKACGCLRWARDSPFCGARRPHGWDGQRRARVQQWFQDKKAGWYAVLEDPRMPVTSTLLDQAHHAIDRKLFMMKGFHHPEGSPPAFLRGLAHLYNLVPYQRRAKHAGQCGVEVEGGTIPTRDWFLNRQILTSGGFRCAMIPLTTKSGGMWKFWPSRLPARHREIVYARRFLLVLWEYSDTGQFAGLWRQ